MDIFENIVLCKECNKRMNAVVIWKDGFRIRALKCPSCSKRIYHPSDIRDYEEFRNLKKRDFHVKLRMVGNSYAVSIPHEIINLFEVHEKIVTIALEESNKIALLFGKVYKEKIDENAD